MPFLRPSVPPPTFPSMRTRGEKGRGKNRAGVSRPFLVGASPARRTTINRTLQARRTNQPTKGCSKATYVAVEAIATVC